MWIVIIIVIVVILIIREISTNNAEINKKITNQGGMSTKYKQVIDYMTKNEGFKITKLSNTHITISSVSITFLIDYIDGDTEISVYGLIPVIGKVKRKFKYPNGFPQEKMIDEIENYLDWKMEEFKKLAGLYIEEKSKVDDTKLKKEDTIRVEEDFKNSYKDIIFEIFDNYRKLAKDDIIWSMENCYSFKKVEAEKVFNLWIDNYLLKIDDEGFYHVDWILTSDIHKLTENDLTRNEWLKLHDKKLRPEEDEYIYFRYAKFIYTETYTVEDFKSLIKSDKLSVKELDPNQFSVVNELGVVVAVCCNTASSTKGITKPVISLVQPVIYQNNGNFIADITKEPFYLLHQLGENTNKVVISEF